MDRPTSCCTTTNIIDRFSRCLCISAPRYETLPEKKREKLETQAVNEIIAQKLFYTEKSGTRTKPVILQAIPRVPLKLRLSNAH